MSTILPAVYSGCAANGKGNSNNDQEGCFFFTRLAECTTIAEFKKVISYMVKRLGFSDFSFTVLKAPPAKSLTTLPNKLREFYLNKNLVNYDFFLEHAVGSDVPIFLSDIEQYITRSPFSLEQNYRNIDHFKLLAKFGYYECYSIPQGFNLESRRAVFSFFAKDLYRKDFCQKVKQCQLLLSTIVEAVTHLGASKFPEYFLDVHFNGMLDLKLKPLRMLEILARDGLKLKEGAAKLGIGIDTANKHVAAAKQTLGATTLANAVYLAMVHGLIKDEKTM